MQKIFLFIFYLITATTAVSQKRQTISYDGKIHTIAAQQQTSMLNIVTDILKGSSTGPVIYSESHHINRDYAGNFHLEIGGGKGMAGQFDSIIWSDGIFYLRTRIDTLGGTNYTMTQNNLLRIPPELSNDYEQGTVNSSEFPDHGGWKLLNKHGKRPRLVTIDLTTSYANLAYPADTYPVYRHYEWCDTDRDGIGNSFMISYSDHTNNFFKENTTLLGEVKLYQVPFQQLEISSTVNEIMVLITKPIPVKNLSETYAIKGPWKFIYYIEW